METFATNEIDTPRKSGRQISRRRFLQSAAVAGFGMAFYAGEIARHLVRVERVTIPIANLPESLRGLRIVQIADLHYGEYSEPAYLRWVIRQVNSLKPDLVLLTGDFISMGPLPDKVNRDLGYRCAEIVSHIECQQRYAVLGNHDALVDPTGVTDALETHRIPVLRNRAVPFERDGGRIWIAGVADILLQNPDLDAAIPRAAARDKEPVILMAHEPDFADVAAQHGGVDLVLSGHTHGGQVRLPFLPPVFLPPMGRKYLEGHFHLGPMQLYVNRGIGTVGVPFRLNAPPEITLITLA
jgi:predicted MPP superfamily phosphohydrolase